MRLLLLLLLYLITSSTIIGDAHAQNETVDSLLIVLKTTKEKTTKVKALNDLSWELLNKGDYDKALKYANNALTIASDISFWHRDKNQKLTDKELSLARREGMATAHHNIGSIYWYKGDFDKTMDSYLKSLQIKEALNAEYPDDIMNKKGMAGSYNNIGNIHYSKGEYEKALELYLKSLKIKEEIEVEHPDDIPNRKGMASSYSNIGAIQQDKGDLDKALEYYFKATKIQEEVDFKKGMGICYNNIGIVYNTKGDFDQALEFHLKSLKIKEETGDKRGMAASYTNIGNCHKKKGDFAVANGDKKAAAHLYDKTLEYYLKCLETEEGIGDKQGLAGSYNSIGSLFLDRKNPKEGRKWIMKSLAVANEIGAKLHILEAFSVLVRADSALGDFKGAFEYHKLYTTYRDSVHNVESEKKMLQAEMEHEYEKKEAIATAEQEKKDVLAREELAKQTMQRNGFIGGFALMLALAGVSYRSYRNKQKANHLLSEQKMVIEEKNKDITDSINYAKQIQQAILPTRERLTESFGNNHFIHFKPRDIVSGDFYWCTEKEGKTFLAVVDCTGHGVPGAFMSMVGSAALSNIINEKNIYNAGEILTQFNKDIRKALNQEEGTNRDGMDMIMCVFDKLKSTVEFSGANNPLYLIRDKELTEIKGDKFSIGGLQPEKERVFTSHRITLGLNSTLYLSTDGYADQFGGEKGKKFKSANFKKLLLSIQDKTMEEQAQLLNLKFEEWKGNLEQVDDVCVIGVRV